MPILPFIGGTPPLTGTNTTKSDVDVVADLLKKMTAGAPPIETRVPVGRQITGAISDALRARATVLAGGVPPREGAFAAEARARREAFEAEMASWRQRQTELANELTKFKIQAEMARTKAVSDEEADRRTKTFEDRLVRERQAEDDHRDQAIEISRWKRDAMQELVKEAAKAGIDPATIKSTDPGKLSQAEIIDLGFMLREAKGEVVNESERIKAQMDAAKAVDPKLKLTGIMFSGEEGHANVRMTPDPMDYLSDVDRRLALNAGIKVYDDDMNPRPAREIHNDISAAREAEKQLKNAERKARLGRIVNPKVNGTVGMKISENLDMAQKARSVLSMLEADKSFAPGGPGAGRMNNYLRYQTANLWYGQEMKDKLIEFDARMQNLFNIEAKIRSGAAVTEPEEIRNRAELPTIVNDRDVMVGRLKLVAEFHEDIVRQLQKTFKIPDEDINWVSGSLSPRTIIPTKLEEGDIVLFGGEEND